MNKATSPGHGVRPAGRRDFLRVGSLSFLGIGLSQYLHLQHLMAAAANSDARKAKARSCILLWLEGGPSQVDTWDPKPNSSFRPISTSAAGIQISELLPRVSRQMDKLAIIRSMHTEENNHPQATHYAVTGHRPNPAMQFPSLGSVIANEMDRRNNIPPYVLSAEMEAMSYFRSGFLGPECDPMVISDPSTKDFKVPDLSLPKSVSAEQLQDRRSVQYLVDQLYRQRIEGIQHSKMDSFTDTAWKMILSPNVREAFDLSKEPQKVRDAYGANGFGQSVLLARRLVEAGSRFVTAAGYGFIEWDTHGDNDQGHRDTLVPPFDQACSTLLEDLEQRGLLDSTVVIAMGEFGRTPHLNPKRGRDHWPQCWSLALGGGGIQGGQVIGASDDKGAYVADRQISIGDLFATIYKAFGIDWEKTYMTPVGRPVKIANGIDDSTGVPIAELV